MLHSMIVGISQQIGYIQPNLNQPDENLGGGVWGEMGASKCMLVSLCVQGVHIWKDTSFLYSREDKFGTSYEVSGFD
jgi:hypothetical protein